MSKPDDLTYAALAGYQSSTPDCKEYIRTSPAWYAWMLGRYLSFTGRSRPEDVRMSRGYSIRCRDCLYKIIDDDGSTTFDSTSFERVN